MYLIVYVWWKIIFSLSTFKLNYQLKTYEQKNRYVMVIMGPQRTHFKLDIQRGLTGNMVTAALNMQIANSKYQNGY